MILAPEDIKEFKNIYFSEYRIELTLKEAEEMASNLLSFYQILTPSHD